MLNIKKMLRETPQYTKELSHAVKIKEIKRGTTRSGLLRIAARVKTTPPQGSGVVKRMRTVIIESLEPVDKIGDTENVLVYCNCDFFHWYGCADVLYKNGAGWKKYASGIMPDARNPKYLKMVCKHCVRVFDEIKKKGW